MIKTILFDLDGTLLPLDESRFIQLYFGGIAKRFSRLGYDGQKLLQAIMESTDATIANDGSVWNVECFWKRFGELFPADLGLLDLQFQAFYQEDFPNVQNASTRQPLAKTIVKLLKDKGYRIIIATNPVFPAIATRQRIAWAGLDLADFELVTTFENAHYCKPNLKYYEEVLQTIHAKPNETIMIGNDALEDMIAGELGMQTYLVTDCLINRQNRDFSSIPHGSFLDLMKFIETFPPVL